ncbi:hypothetical protein BDQ17DRAFT_1409223 [Cyathus striatus]|nr:hypothetical protein BDQ17DRAFT_1409223 [Cyathus striatus]
MEREMRNQWVGPMPVDDFIKDFMPVSEDIKASCPIVDKGLFKAVSSLKTESAIYKKMIEIIKEHPIDFLPGYKLIDTSNKEDTHGDQKWHIDLTCYRDNVNVEERANQLDKAEWGIEIKRSDGDDSFGDANRFIDTKSESAKSTRGQLTMYAAEWFNHQHRTHTFMIFISKTIARFFYFDRSGAVVSDRFNYADNSKPLIQFMWFFAHLTEEQKGIDTTVQVATKDQAKNFLSKLDTFHTRVAMTEANPNVLEMLKAKKNQLSEEQQKTKASDIALTDEDWDRIWDLAEPAIWSSLSSKEKDDVVDAVKQRMPCETRAVVVIQVPDGDTYREVIGQGFSSRAESLAGRSTRAWLVWDVEKEKLLYLKDSWRSCLDGMEKETSILEDLNKEGVRYVPQLICGGDVANQTTRADKFNEKSWVRGEVKLTPRAHHRFLVDFIGRPVKHFSHSKQMLQATYDAFSGHREAWEKCGILHRDVSGNNVMLDRWGRGVLNDWDLAKRQKVMNQPPRTHARTGTWYFMSTLLLQNPGKQHTVHDDLESFVLLVLYLGLSYLKHNRNGDLGSFVYHFFEECSVDDGGAFVGGTTKMKIFLNGKAFMDKFEFTENDPLQCWLKAAYDAVSHWITTDVLKEKMPTLAMSIDLQKLELYDHTFLSSIFQQALASPDWPVAQDKGLNEFKGVEPMLYKSNAGSSSGISRKRRSSEPSDEPNKRQKQSKSSDIYSGMEVVREVEDED